MTDSRSARFALVALVAAGGCGTGEETLAESEEGEAVARASTFDLSSDLLQRLTAEYPVLRQERAPQPQPDGEGLDPPDEVLETIEGEATFYADRFEGRRTASGIPFRQNQFVAAHRAFPFGTLLRVTNLRNDRSVNVRVVDRGPHGSAALARNTIIDLSRRAAETLGYTTEGRTPVRVEVLEWGEGLPLDS